MKKENIKDYTTEECYGGDLEFIFECEEGLHGDIISIKFCIIQSENYMCEGFLKWDGCINIELVGINHFCGYEHMHQVMLKIPAIIYLYGVSKMPILKEYGKIENLIK